MRRRLISVGAIAIVLAPQTGLAQSRPRSELCSAPFPTKYELSLLGKAVWRCDLERMDDWLTLSIMRWLREGCMQPQCPDRPTRGANVNIPENDGLGTTPLMIAAERGDPVLLGYLMEFGANPNAKRADGMTALLFAVKENHTNFARFLVDLGAEVNVPDNQWTPLMWAMFRKNDELVEFFLAKGANPNARVQYGFTALHFAASVLNNDKFIRLLLKNGAFVDSRADDGQTALMRAVFSKRNSAARFLIEQGADVNARDNEGYTPLMYAVMSYPSGNAEAGNAEAVKLLLANGADVHARANDGRTALTFAIVWLNVYPGEKADRQRVIDLLKQAGAKE